ncbi:hypothetical protein SprV_0301133400 [Sparganum proliferum]
MSGSQISNTSDDNCHSSTPSAHCFLNLTGTKSAKRIGGHKRLYRPPNFIPSNAYYGDDENAVLAKSMVDFLLWTSGKFTDYEISEFGNCCMTRRKEEFYCDIFIQNMTFIPAQQGNNQTHQDSEPHIINPVYVRAVESCFFRRKPATTPETTRPPTTTTELVSTTEIDAEIYLRELAHETRTLLMFINHPKGLTYSKLENSFGAKSSSNASLVYAFANLTEIDLTMEQDENATLTKAIIDLLLWTNDMFESYSISKVGDCDVSAEKELHCDVFIQNLTVNQTQQGKNSTLLDDCLYTVELVYLRAVSVQRKIEYPTFFILKKITAIYPAFKANNMTKFDMAMMQFLKATHYMLPQKQLIAPY